MASPVVSLTLSAEVMLSKAKLSEGRVGRSVIIAAVLNTKYYSVNKGTSIAYAQSNATKLAPALSFNYSRTATSLPLHKAMEETLRRRKLIHDIEDLEPSIKDKLIYLANAVIRDAKTGKAYA